MKDDGKVELPNIEDFVSFKKVKLFIPKFFTYLNSDIFFRVKRLSLFGYVSIWGVTIVRLYSI